MSPKIDSMTFFTDFSVRNFILSGVSTVFPIEILSDKRVVSPFVKILF